MSKGNTDTLLVLAIVGILIIVGMLILQSLFNQQNSILQKIVEALS